MWSNENNKHFIPFLIYQVCLYLSCCWVFLNIHSKFSIAKIHNVSKCFNPRNNVHILTSPALFPNAGHVRKNPLAMFHISERLGLWKLQSSQMWVIIAKMIKCQFCNSISILKTLYCSLEPPSQKNEVSIVLDMVQSFQNSLESKGRLQSNVRKNSLSWGTESRGCKENKKTRELGSGFITNWATSLRLNSQELWHKLWKHYFDVLNWS